MIDSLAFGGQGIGSVDGFKVFVDGVAPGDEVEVQIFKKKKSYAEGRVLQFLKRSADRIEPRCKHFDTCGGCKWQFLPYDKQCEAKEQQVRDAVERIAQLNHSPEFLPILPCESAWNYRNKMELSFGPGGENRPGMGSNAEETAEPMLGFYPPRFHYEVFNLEECFLQSDATAYWTERVRNFMRENGLRHFDDKKAEGFLRTLTLREGKNTGERMLILTTSKQDFPQEEAFVELVMADEVPETTKVTSLYWIRIHQEKGKRTEIVEEHLAGKPVLTERLHDLEFDILPQAFFQTNTHQAEKLYSEVIRQAELSGGETVFDLYCGTGTIGLFCAQAAERVVGVDINASAIENAQANAKKNGLTNADYQVGSVGDLITELDEKPDVIVLDPPRSGLGEDVVKHASAFGARRIVYVSCNPTSMARDLKFFEEQGYHCERVQPVDMFPQTYHIETVCSLSQSSAASRDSNS